ncbi:MAG: DsbA family protein [Gammaproteobacteria bacterium]|nr:DsbA family protein [Gammaproteobacteria bacterium]
MQTPELRLHVFSDYICPFCYIGSERLLRLKQEFDLKINWCHVEIHPEVPDAGLELGQLGYADSQWKSMQDNLRRLAEEDGLDLILPLRVSRSQKALLLAEAAKRQGRKIYYPLHKALFDAYFHASRDIGDEETLREIASTVGMEEDSIEDAWREQEYQERLTYNLNLARQIGIHSTPTFVIGDCVLGGVQPLDRMREVMEDTLRNIGSVEDRVH